MSEVGKCRLPHGRGDVSDLTHMCILQTWSSPRAWGCFSTGGSAVVSRKVFPTGVGMFPKEHFVVTTHGCLPHGRGDVSESNKRRLITNESSPRAWGCFRLEFHERQEAHVFPTGVGMFPIVYRKTDDLIRLPHGRGDVSMVSTFPVSDSKSSPRAWGCFLTSSTDFADLIVFPTGVGMFLSDDVVYRLRRGLPHGRGDVS